MQGLFVLNRDLVAYRVLGVLTWQLGDPVDRRNKTPGSFDGNPTDERSIYCRYGRNGDKDNKGYRTLVS